MTSLLSAILASIMLLTGTGSGAVTLSNMDVTIAGEGIALDPTLTAAYVMEDDRLTTEVSMGLDGEDLFKTDLVIDGDSVTAVLADGTALAVTGQYLEETLAKNGISLEEVIAGIEGAAQYAQTGFDTQAQKDAMKDMITSLLAEELASEESALEIDGEEVPATHLYGTIENDAMLNYSDSMYMQLLGEENYNTVMAMLNELDSELEVTSIASIYEQIGMTISMDVDATLTEEGWGLFDATEHFVIANEDIGEAVELATEISAVIAADDEYEVNVRMEPTEEVPLDLAVFVQLDEGVTTYSMNMNVEDELTSITASVDFTTDGYAFDLAVSGEADEEGVNLTATGTLNEARIEAALIEFGEVALSAGLTVTVGACEIEDRTNGATIIGSDEELDSAMESAMGAAIAYLSDYEKLMGNASVNAVMQKLGLSNDGEDDYEATEDTYTDGEYAGDEEIVDLLPEELSYKVPTFTVLPEGYGEPEWSCCRYGDTEQASCSIMSEGDGYIYLYADNMDYTADQSYTMIDGVLTKNEGTTYTVSLAGEDWSIHWKQDDINVSMYFYDSELDLEAISAIIAGMEF